MDDATSQTRSPRVLADEWGRLDVEGLGELKHHPGIQPEDVHELVEHDPAVIVLSRGRELRLETMAATLDALEQRGIRVVWEETGDAIESYNRLAGEGVRVAAPLNSTC